MNNATKSIVSAVLKTLLILAWLLALSGCASNTGSNAYEQTLRHWQLDAHAYSDSLGVSHQDSYEQVVELSGETKELIKKRFGKLKRNRVPTSLVRWLLDPDGVGMVYDPHANFSPSEALEQRRGNCLSFTILLITLAAELGVELEYNEVDLPNIWEYDENNGMVLYRHINAVYKTAQRRLVFDLALDEYDPGYPQRKINSRQAVGLLHSNLAVDKLGVGDISQAFHHIKLAITLNPQSSDTWANAGVLFKRSKQPRFAEAAFEHALHLNRNNTVAASNLERLYRTQGQLKLADRYAKRARVARLNNPYFQFERASKAFESKNYTAARKSIRRALKLHDLDPRFFALSSLIESHLGRYISALKDLETAQKLSTNADDQQRYYTKAEYIVRLMNQDNSKQR